MGLPVITTGNRALDLFLQQVRQYLDAQKGTALTGTDRALRISDLPGIVKVVQAADPAKTPTYASQMDKLAEDLMNTRLFKSLIGPGSGIDDLLDGYPREVLADVRAVSGNSTAAVTSEAVVVVEDGLAMAARVDTVEASLTGLEGDIASVEVAYLALASDVTGLEAQYTVKVTAGGAVAGFGIAATSPVGGTPSSAFLISADKFAIVSPSYTGGFNVTPSAANMPFSVDADGVYVKGRLNQSSTISVAGASTFSISYGASTYSVQCDCSFNLTAASSGLAYCGLLGKVSGIGSYQFGVTGQTTGAGSSINIGVNGHATGGSASYGGAFYGSNADVILNGSGKIQWGATMVNAPSGNVNHVLRGDGTYGKAQAAVDADTLQGADLLYIANQITTYVQANAACRGGSTFNLTVPSLGTTYTGCSIS